MPKQILQKTTNTGKKKMPITIKAAIIGALIGTVLSAILSLLVSYIIFIIPHNTIKEITIIGKDRINKESLEKYYVDIKFADGSLFSVMRNCRWEVDNGLIYIDKENGQVIVNSNFNLDKFLLTVEYKGKTQTKSILIKKKIPVSISINGDNKINEGDKKLFSATMIYDDKSTEKINPRWFFYSDTLNNVDNNGYVTAGRVKESQYVTLNAPYNGLRAEKKILITNYLYDITFENYSSISKIVINNGNPTSFKNKICLETTDESVKILIDNKTVIDTTLRKAELNPVQLINNKNGVEENAKNTIYINTY